MIRFDLLGLADSHAQYIEGYRRQFPVETTPWVEYSVFCKNEKPLFDAFARRDVAIAPVDFPGLYAGVAFTHGILQKAQPLCEGSFVPASVAQWYETEPVLHLEQVRLDLESGCDMFVGCLDSIIRKHTSKDYQNMAHDKVLAYIALVDQSIKQGCFGLV